MPESIPFSTTLACLSASLLQSCSFLSAKGLVLPLITPLRLAYGTGEFQFGDLYLPEKAGPYPVAILIHGGYWRAHFGLDLMHGLAADLARRGIAAWNIEYRRVGNVGGGWPGTFLDVAQATDYLRTIAIASPLDLERIVPVGHSAGGHLAFWLAARQRIARASPVSPHETSLIPAGVLSLAGVLDLKQAYALHLSNDAVVGLLGARPDEDWARYMAASPGELLPLGIPQVLIHGTADGHVPLQVSRDYAAAAKLAGDPITYLELPGVDHFAIIDPATESWQRIVRELDRLFQDAEQSTDSNSG
jgi:acetyl esterase/lipase